MHYLEEFDMWEKFGVKFGGYNSSIDKKIIDIIKCHLENNNLFSSEVAKKLELDQDFVELVFYMMCSTELWDYGTSPRGCFPVNKETCNKFLSDCEKQFYIMWIAEED